MNIHRHAIVLSISTLVLISACSSPAPRSDAMVGAPAGGPANGQRHGRVSAIEVLPVEARTSGGGAVLGAVLGAVIGHQVGGGTGQNVATGVGAVGGALLGNSMEKRGKSNGEIYRISVRFDGGGVGQFDYERIDDLRIGDRVSAEGGELRRI